MSGKEYKIIGAYDSETTNVKVDGLFQSFPILHQLGLIQGDVTEITPDNVERMVSINLYRHSVDLYTALDELLEIENDYVPVILCHNLAFDMYGLSPWLMDRNVKVLAKSARKPITFTITDDEGKPKLVIWDTLIFSQQRLERMGVDCGYEKGIGEWDYELVRTPETPLTSEEIDYAKRDIYTLLTWVSWWLKHNPDIAACKLGQTVVTKTGVVRERRKVRFSKLHGIGMRKNVQYYWLSRCDLESPKTDDELFTMLASTRGGFTFCSMVNASKPFDLLGTDSICAAYDATSQHPAQLVSHMFPFNFREMPESVLDLAFQCVGLVSFERILEKWERPFTVAFYACFEFENLRPRKDSLFDKYGIFPIASARFKTPEQLRQDEENGDKAAYMEHMQNRSYCDSIEGGNCAFGKVVSARKARFYLTELAAWEVWQAYEWDSVKAVHGYLSGKFIRPNDIDVISTMQFYQAKNEFKETRKRFYNGKPVDNGDALRTLGISDALVNELENGIATSGDIEATYLSLKADLNAIFGLSATNQYRRDTVLDDFGISYVGDFGICNAPRTNKVWYQFGQRIVGYSRIAQICAMYLVEPYVQTIVNGDTDSIKVICNEDALPDIENALSRLGRAIDKGKEFVCSRVRAAYPDMYDSLDEIGYYAHEFTTKRFCASWNKAYCLQNESGFSFTLAGIPTRKRENAISSFIGINGLADRLFKLGFSFDDIASLFLGYNVTYAHDVLLMNGRRFPEWGDVFTGRVTDYLGNVARVTEPYSLALYPMSKTVNDTSTSENAVNMKYALQNNPNVNIENKLIYSGGILDFEDIA